MHALGGFVLVIEVSRSQEHRRVKGLIQAPALCNPNRLFSVPISRVGMVVAAASSGCCKG